MEQQSPEFILEAFADPNSVRDIVRGTKPLPPRHQTGTRFPQTPWPTCQSCHQPLLVDWLLQKGQRSLTRSHPTRHPAHHLLPPLLPRHPSANARRARPRAALRARARDRDAHRPARRHARAPARGGAQPAAPAPGVWRQQRPRPGDGAIPREAAAQEELVRHAWRGRGVLGGVDA